MVYSIENIEYHDISDGDWRIAWGETDMFASDVYIGKDVIVLRERIRESMANAVMAVEMFNLLLSDYEG